MNGRYIKPKVTHYSREEVEEMIGPVRTQYATDCNCGIEAPEFVQEFESIRVRIDVSNLGCNDLDSVFIELVDGNNGNAQGGAGISFWSFPLSAGTPDGGGLVFDLGSAGQIGVRGEVCFRATLMSGVANGGGTSVELPGEYCGTACTFIEEIED